MAAIAHNSLDSPVPVTLAVTALTGADTLTYNAASRQVLFLENTTVAPVTVTIDGDKAPTAFAPGGIGKTLDLSAGLAIVIPASKVVAIELRNLQRYLVGTINVTGTDTGVNAWITE